VPALPQSITEAGVLKPPAPSIRQRPSPIRSTLAPKAWTARAVARTSSPSRRPSTSVTPEAMPPRIIERWDMDLSPGARTVPARAFERLAVSWDGIFTRFRLACRKGRAGGAKDSF